MNSNVIEPVLRGCLSELGLQPTGDERTHLGIVQDVSKSVLVGLPLRPLLHPLETKRASALNAELSTGVVRGRAAGTNARELRLRTLRLADNDSMGPSERILDFLP